jgi:CubicO group peptidase (beta-lactamase class C family)
VSWKGNIIYRKSFGRHTYDPKSPVVSNTDLYDIASVTKTVATALALMKLQEEEEIDIEKKASRYYHALRKTNKRDLVIEDILTHRAGLKPFVPFWKNTLEKGKPAFNIYHFEKDVNYSVQVADSMFILKSYIDKLWKEIYDTPLSAHGEYVYSDIGLLLMQRVVENVTKLPLDEYLDTHFYEPLGLTRLSYNPVKKKVPLSRIAPTELDTTFRKRLVHGFVHDPTAAMLGGVAGHAGLFSDAYNVAVVMQMLLNGGEYGGHRFLKKETVKLFTERYIKEGTNRRGLLFDKPETGSGKTSPAARSASSETFGHTGFTGTAAWADPENDLVFVFLSNRVHPSANDNKLAKGNYRTDLMEAVYEVLRKRNSEQ